MADRQCAREFMPQYRARARELKTSMPPETIYLAGPMTGKPEFNRAEFQKYAEKYRAAGFRVLSPPEMDKGDWSKPYSYYIRRDIKVLLEEGVSRIYLLPGWQNSRGARLEHHIATLIDIPLYDAETGNLYSESVSAEGYRLVHTDRGEQYGHPIFDLTRSADIFTAIIRKKLKPGERLEAEDMALGMVGIKLSREVFKPKRDNRVDTVGYVEVYEMIRAWRDAHPNADPRDFYL